MNYILLYTVSDIGNDILSWVNIKSQFLVGFLPRSPFRSIINSMGNIPYIDTISWFVPIDEIVLLLMYWTTAIGIYYVYSIALRWIKAID